MRLPKHPPSQQAPTPRAPESEDDDDDSQDLEFAQWRRRRGLREVDDESESEGERDEQDMFAEAEPELEKAEQAEDEGIEGQEAGPAAELYSGDEGVTAFNLDEELEEGSIDAQGAFVRNARDKHAIHDSWLAGQTHASSVRRAKAASDRLAARREAQEKLDEASNGARSVDQLYLGLLQLLKPRETLTNALSRLGRVPRGPAGGAKRVPAWKQRLLDRKAGQAALDSTAGAAVAELTELGDQLLGMGELGVFETTYEQICRRLRLAGKLSDSWQPGDAVPGAVAISRAPTLWEYKWAEDATEVFGPFPASEMAAWSAQGFFANNGAGVFVRRVDASASLNPLIGFRRLAKGETFG